MADKLSVLFDLDSAFNRFNCPSFCLKPLQVKCFEYLLKGKILLPFYGLAVEPLNRAAANF